MMVHVAEAVVGAHWTRGGGGGGGGGGEGRSWAWRRRLLTLSWPGAAGQQAVSTNETGTRRLSCFTQEREPRSVCYPDRSRGGRDGIRCRGTYLYKFRKSVFLLASCSS